MRKILLSAAAMLGVVSLASVCTSCSSEEETTYIYYQVNPYGNTTFELLDVCEQMRDGLREAFGIQGDGPVIVSGADDAKAISACDKVYEETVGQYEGGVIRLTRGEPVSNPEDEGESVVVKEYQYN